MRELTDGLHTVGQCFDLLEYILGRVFLLILMASGFVRFIRKDWRKK